MIVETALVFSSSDCSICKKIEERLINDFLRYDVLLSFVHLPSDCNEAISLGIAFTPAFYISGTVFYSFYDKDSVERTVQTMRQNNNVA